MPRKCGTREGDLNWLNSEPCGLFCGLVTWGLVMYGQYTVTFCIIIPWFQKNILGLFHIVLFNFFSVLAIYSHYKAMTTDPGAVPSDAVPLSTDQEEHDYETGNRINGQPYRKWCKRCQAFKPIRAHHCSICKRCVIKMDHHCPWVNNCIGVGNHKLFLHFLLWINVISTYALMLIISWYWHCYVEITNEYSICGTAGSHVLILLLLIESLLFGLFTFCMKAEQSTVVMTNQTQIDRMKSFTPDNTLDVNEVFGGSASTKFRMHWLYPIPVKFPQRIKDLVYGYTLPYQDLTDLTLSSSRKNTIMSTDSHDEVENGYVEKNNSDRKQLLNTMNHTEESRESRESRESKECYNNEISTSINNNDNTSPRYMNTTSKNLLYTSHISTSTTSPRDLNRQEMIPLTKDINNGVIERKEDEEYGGQEYSTGRGSIIGSINHTSTQYTADYTSRKSPIDTSRVYPSSQQKYTLNSPSKYHQEEVKSKYA